MRLRGEDQSAFELLKPGTIFGGLLDSASADDYLGSSGAMGKLLLIYQTSNWSGFQPGVVSLMNPDA